MLDLLGVPYLESMHCCCLIAVHDVICWNAKINMVKYMKLPMPESPKFID